MSCGCECGECSSGPQLDEAEAKADLLVEALTAYESTEVFPVGTLVEWKPGMRVTLAPEYGTPAIVFGHLGSTVHQIEPGVIFDRCDILLGIFRGGDFVVYPFDSKRFQRYEQVASGVVKVH